MEWWAILVCLFIETCTQTQSQLIKTGTCRKAPTCSLGTSAVDSTSPEGPVGAGMSRSNRLAQGTTRSARKHCAVSGCVVSGPTLYMR